MRSLPPENCLQYLAIARSLGNDYPLFDMHVHPYEVLFDRFTYQEESSSTGVVSIAGKSYTTPTATHFRFPEVTDFNDDPKSQRLQDISVMLLKKIYAHVGEQVFVDQMELTGIGKVLLLPVASESVTPEQFSQRLSWVKRFYGNEDKFWIAGSIPGSLEGSDLRQYVRDLKKEHGIRAIKCHPVVTGIDLSTGNRKEWLEELLAACGESQLPLIIHSGRNNPYWGGRRGNYGCLENLTDINISSSGHPVILAHAGFHRCRKNEVEQEGLPILGKMLQSHSNLFIDISGLTLEPLKLVLGSVAGNRILFGSDALYSSQWESVTLMMHALKELGMPLEENFIQFANINSRKAIFEEQQPCQIFSESDGTNFWKKSDKDLSRKPCERPLLNVS